jgi:hypothetical protein
MTRQGLFDELLQVVQMPGSEFAVLLTSHFGACMQTDDSHAVSFHTR